MAAFLSIRQWCWCVSLPALLATGRAPSGSEKGVKHPIPRLYGAGDSQFSRAMGTLLDTGILDGNRVEALLNGDEIFPAITAASRSIHLSTPYFIPDASAIKALTDAAKRGVTVQIITVGSHTDSETVRRALGRLT